MREYLAEHVSKPPTNNTRRERNPVSMMYMDAAIFQFKDITLLKIFKHRRRGRSSQFILFKEKSGPTLTRI